jgi:c-di-GMP-binding flagellar brake protein YcgR
MTAKVLINEQNMSTFICPKCNKAKTANVSKFKDIKKAVKIKCNCPCGHSYSVILERRKYNRKQLNLVGAYTSLKDNNRGSMIVVDLSRIGLGMELGIEHKFDIGEKISLDFRLDDKQESLIEREVVVRSIKGNFVGVEFCRHDHHDQLGPYIAWRID